MTQLLVSVRNAEEARAALLGGADWIDLKEPTNGPLGAVAASEALSAVDAVAGQASVSAAAGELIDWPLSAARELLAVAGIGQLKLGLSGCVGRDWKQDWFAAQREIADAGQELVAVIYADAAAARSPAPLEVLNVAAAAGSRWLLIDTFNKSSGTLIEILDVEMVRELFQRAQSLGLTTAAAGRLTPAAIEALPLDVIDVVAVRSAACGGDRRGAVSVECVAALQSLLRSGAIT